MTEDVPKLLAEVRRLRAESWVERTNARTHAVDAERRRWYAAFDGYGQGKVYEGLVPEVVAERWRDVMRAHIDKIAELEADLDNWVPR